MNKENPVLQRDQIKRPSFHRVVNSNSNGLSSPFSFMDFGQSSQFSLNSVLTNFSRENANQTNTVSTDPYLKPLSLDRLKSAHSSTRDNGPNSQYGSNFIKFSPNNLRNNDFSANFFLRLQSTRTDNVESAQKKSNEIFKSSDLINISNPLNGVNKHERNKRPRSSILTPNYLNGVANAKPETPVTSIFQNLSNLKDDSSVSLINIRPITANPAIRNARDTPANSFPVAGSQSNTKFYVKSFKTDALIYNPVGKTLSTVSSDTKPDPNDNSPLKISTTANLYQQVKQEVEEYRKQRRKEVMLDIDVYPVIKPVSTEHLFSTNEEVGKSTEKSPVEPTQLKIVELKTNASSLLTESPAVGKENINSKKNGNRKPYVRPKSVTFNDKVETRDFFEDSSSSESEDEDSNDASSTDNESHGSIVSTESESEDHDQSNVLSNNRNSSLSESITKPSPEISPQETIKPDIKEENESIVGCDNRTKETDTEMTSNSGSNEDESESDESSTINISPCATESTTDPSKLNGRISAKSNDESNSRSTSASSSVNQSVGHGSHNTSSTSKAVRIAEKQLKKVFNESKNKANSCLFKQDILGMTAFKETQHSLPLIFSKFSNIPPVINFVGEGEKIEQLPWQLRKLLRWRTSFLTPVIVKQTIARSGFRPSRLTCSGDDLDVTESGDWILYFGKHMKGPVFKSIKEYQKVNHFPGSFQLGRKDRLWRNIFRMQQEIGNKDFDFIPQTFCLPTDLELFKQCWESGGSKHKWIIKPPASARGLGVKVVYKWNQIPKRRPVVVQKYISNPYLINDSKFDLRLYVFITGINPLRIYLYDDGLVRFASTKYTNSVKSLQNRYVHLTNYSINKQNIEYLDNNDNEACKGHKWSLKSLWTYLKKRGVNTDNVWQKIKDLVVKTIISAEEAINASVNVYCKSTYSVQELFGFDVILDEHLKPWILEVNVSPSLHSDSPLDVIIKGGMIKDMFNLSGFILPEPTDVDPPTNGRTKSPTSQTIPSSDLYVDRRFWLYEPSDDEIAKMKHFVSIATNGTEFRFDLSDNLPNHILDCLTPNDIRILVQCLDEYERKGHFERVYPLTLLNASKKYLSYFERIHYANLLVTCFLTKYNRNNQAVRVLETLCQKKLHQLSAQNGDKIDSKHIWRNPNFSGDTY